MKRLLLVLVLLVLLGGVTTVTWTLMDLPPIRFVFRYGFTPRCEPTGKRLEIEGIEFVEIGPGIFRMGSKYRAEGGDFIGNLCARFGLPWGVALRAVTLAPAEALGVGDLYGSLEPGKVGNLVVWTGDPFELSTRAETVVIRGVVTSPDNRQIELLRRYRYLDGESPDFE